MIINSSSSPQCCQEQTVTTTTPEHHQQLTLLIGPGARQSFQADVRHFRTTWLNATSTSTESLQEKGTTILQLDYLTASSAAQLDRHFCGHSFDCLTLAAYDVDVAVLEHLRTLLLAWSSSNSSSNHTSCPSLTSLSLYIRLGSNTDYFPQSWANSSRLLGLLNALNQIATDRLQRLTVLLHQPIFSTNVNASGLLDLSGFFARANSLREFNFSTPDDVLWTPLIDWLLISEYWGKGEGNGSLQRIAIGNPDEHFTVFERLLAYPRLARKVVELPNLGCRAGSVGNDLDVILKTFLADFEDS